MALEYSDIHREFAKSMFNMGCIRLAEAETLLKNVLMSFENTCPDVTLKDVIDKINDYFRLSNLKIDIVTSMHDQKVFVVFVNTAQSAIMKLQGMYKPLDVEFFRLIINELAVSDDHSLPRILVLSLMDGDHSNDATVLRFENLLDEWIEDGYFYSKNGFIHFGVRAVAEFGELLRCKYNLDKCDLCKAVLFKGIDCSNDACDGSFHVDCISKYMSRSKKCPNCKSVWDLQ